MEYRKIEGITQCIPPLSLGTWVFGGDSWWGKQDDRDSIVAMDTAISDGITLIDTAPVYGRGRSEKIIGDFLVKKKLRAKIILATKLGLSWQGPKILHNLTRKRMLEEFDESRLRLRTDYFDLYQVHWPDQNTPIGETAETMRKFYEKGIIKSIGVSNYSVSQMKEFMNYSPLHCLQPEYSMFKRCIEDEIVPFCQEHKISIITYAPLYSGLLTGKFYLDNLPVPDDTNRRMKKKELEEPLFSINKDTLSQLKEIASGYKKTLSQLVINWNFSQKGITSAIVGTRNLKQVQDNLGSLNWSISDADMQKINQILSQREHKIRNA